MVGEGLPSVGVVGCGYWGKNLVRDFHKLGSLKIICDVDQPRLEELGTTYGVATTSNLEDLLRDDTLSAIAVAAPAVQHHAIAKRALLAGKDVFVEKPLALTVEDGQELVRIAHDTQRILMVGHILQYHPAVLELERLVRGGELGKVYYIYSSRLNLGKLRTEENILWSFAPHDISAIVFLLGESPASVTAQGASCLNRHIADMTFTDLAFASGVKAQIFVSWLHPYKEQKLVVVGAHKMAVFDDTETERKLTIYPHRIDWVNRHPVAHKAAGEVVPLQGEQPLLAECRHFLECVRDRTTPRTNGESGVEVLKILHACEQSMQRQGQPLQAAPPPAAPQYFVHPTALLDQPSEVGAGTKIWHYSHVMANSKLGKDCNLGQNVHIASHVKIGNNVKIQNNVSVYEGVELEDDVFCGPSMVFTNVNNPRSHVNRKNQYARTLVKRGATLGANSTIVCGVTVGAYSFVAAGAVVTHDVPDYALVMGVPARQAGWVCHCGVRLELTDYRASCPECGSRYSVSAQRGLAAYQTA